MDPFHGLAKYLEGSAMESTKVKTSAEKLAKKDGITFYRINSEKFKTNRVDIFFLDRLEKRAS